MREDIVGEQRLSSVGSPHESGGSIVQHRAVGAAEGHEAGHAIPPGAHVPSGDESRTAIAISTTTETAPTGLSRFVDGRSEKHHAAPAAGATSVRREDSAAAHTGLAIQPPDFRMAVNTAKPSRAVKRQRRAQEFSHTDTEMATHPRRQEVAARRGASSAPNQHQRPTAPTANTFAAAAARGARTDGQSDQGKLSSPTPWVNAAGESVCRAAIHRAETQSEDDLRKQRHAWQTIKLVRSTELPAPQLDGGWATVVCMRTALRIIREIVPRASVVQTVEFPKVKGLVLATIRGAGEPRELMATLWKKHQPCIAGLQEEHVDGGAIVYTTKGSTLARRRGSIVVAPPKRISSKGDPWLPAKWATQTWWQQALAELGPVAGVSVTDDGNLRVVPGDQTIGDLIGRAQAADLDVKVATLPPDKAWKAKIHFGDGMDVGTLAKELIHVSEALRRLGLKTLREPTIGHGMALLDLIETEGGEPTITEGIYKVAGCLSVVGLHKKGSEDPVITAVKLRRQEEQIRPTHPTEATAAAAADATTMAKTTAAAAGPSTTVSPGTAPEAPAAKALGPKPAVLVRRQNEPLTTARDDAHVTHVDVDETAPDMDMTAAHATSAANERWEEHNAHALKNIIGNPEEGHDTHHTAANFHAAMATALPQGPQALPPVGSAQGSTVADLIPRMPTSAETNLITMVFNRVADKSRICLHPCDFEPTYNTVALCVADAWEQEEPSAFLQFSSSTTDPLAAPIALSCTMNEDIIKVTTLAEHHRDKHALARYFARAPREVQQQVLQASTMEEAAYALAATAQRGSAAQMVMVSVFARRFIERSPRWGALLP